MRHLEQSDEYGQKADGGGELGKGSWELPFQGCRTAVLEDGEFWVSVLRNVKVCGSAELHT